MQPTGGGGGSGPGELSRGGGLTRFRSAPATWLEALLESEEENDVVVDPLKPSSTPHSLSQLLHDSTGASDNSSNYSDPSLFDAGGASSGIGFHRQNSSPADLLTQISSSASDSYFCKFGIPAKFESVTSSLDVSPSGKRSREKGEQSGRLHGGMGSILDSEMEKLLEDSVPCRVRAKRGCATHPRSIAERVRRTRISDRIRKLQELVPNMDKKNKMRATSHCFSNLEPQGLFYVF